MIERKDDQDYVAVYKSMASYKHWALGVAISFAILNFLMIQAFILVGKGQLSYSTYWSPVSHSRPVTEIAELAVYSQRIAPNGNVVPNRWIEITFDNGSALDTYYLMENEHIEPFIQAIMKNSDPDPNVTRIEGPKL